MSIHKAFWPEILRIWAQWFGIGLASIPSGLLLGILLRYGMKDKEALAIALSLGFVLALVFWVAIGRWFAVPEPQCVLAVSSANIQIEPVPALAFATAVLCVSLYAVQQPPAIHGMPSTMTANPDALSKL